MCVLVTITKLQNFDRMFTGRKKHDVIFTKIDVLTITGPFLKMIPTFLDPENLLGNLALC